MPFNFQAYLRDRGIRAEPGREWLNIPCPLCRSEIYGSTPGKAYLGYNLAKGHFHCWRCGSHKAEDVVMALEGCQWHEACGIVNRYHDDHLITSKPRKAQGLQGTINWPPGAGELTGWHRQYLQGRGFNPDFLAAKYGIMATAGIGPYAWRVMAPVILDGRWVSYQGRDITGRHPAKYKACPKELELVDHKTICYNLDNCHRDEVLVVEGFMDTWRLGDDCCSTFGTSFTPGQVLLLSSRFGRVFVVYDPEPEAQCHARELCGALEATGTEARNMVLSHGDPGDMTDEEAARLKNELLGG